ncbi:hypothetical protein BV20DRAFT_979938 [Pilatotrama ljubarskyi]|nr:hypothetical protein BV20DRAFT_979938 [Pilatotrama ljubarskyi]
MPELPVMIAQFHSGIGAEGVRPYQWHVCVETGALGRFTVATVFYIRGSDAAGYTFEFRDNVRYKTSEAYRGATFIGTIRHTDLPKLPEHFASVEIERGSYASHLWAYRAARKLAGHRMLDRALLAIESIAGQLASAEAAWERGDD